MELSFRNNKIKNQLTNLGELYKKYGQLSRKIIRIWQQNMK